MFFQFTASMQYRHGYGYIDLLHSLHHILRQEVDCPFLDTPVEFRFILTPRPKRAEAGILGPGWTTEDLTEALPLLVCVDPNGAPSVLITVTAGISPVGGSVG